MHPDKCSRCRTHPPAHPRKTCQRCIEKIKEYKVGRLRKVIEEGICSRCQSRPAAPKKRTCQRCLDQVNNYNRTTPGRYEQMVRYAAAVRKKRVEAGECVCCGVKSKTYRCSTCLAKHNEYRKRSDVIPKIRKSDRRYRDSPKRKAWLEANKDRINARRRERYRLKKVDPGTIILKDQVKKVKNDITGLNAFLYAPPPDIEGV